MNEDKGFNLRKLTPINYKTLNQNKNVEVKKIHKEKKQVGLKGSYHDMIVEAIANLNERTGSSRHAIKNFIATNYKIDVNGPYVNRYLKLGVETGELKQVKQSFKLNYDVKKQLIDNLLVSSKKKKRVYKLKSSLLKDSSKKSLPIKKMIQEMLMSGESFSLDEIISFLKHKHKLTDRNTPSIKAIFTKNLNLLWKEDNVEDDVIFYKAILKKNTDKNISFEE